MADEVKKAFKGTWGVLGAFGVIVGVLVAVMVAMCLAGFIIYRVGPWGT